MKNVRLSEEGLQAGETVVSPDEKGQAVEGAVRLPCRTVAAPEGMVSKAGGGVAEAADLGRVKVLERERERRAKEPPTKVRCQWCPTVNHLVPAEVKAMCSAYGGEIRCSGCGRKQTIRHQAKDAKDGGTSK